MSGVDVLAVLDSLQFGFNHRRCPLCAGWNVGPNGETDKVHTATCPVPQARAAIAELIGALKDARAALDNVGLIDTYIDFDAVQAASDRADAALAAVSPK